MSHYMLVVVGEDVDHQLAPYAESLDVEEYEDSDGELTTYNPDSKYDYYTVGGRYKGRLKLKTGHLADMALIGDVDLSHAITPYAILINGEWIENSVSWTLSDSAREIEGVKWKAFCGGIFTALSKDTQITVLDCHM